MKVIKQKWYKNGYFHFAHQFREGDKFRKVALLWHNLLNSASNEPIPKALTLNSETLPAFYP